MLHAITEITIENIKKNTFITRQIKNLVCKDGSKICLACSDPFGKTVVTFYIYVNGNICECTSDNEDLVIGHVSGFEVINKNNCKPANINAWTNLLQ